MSNTFIRSTREARYIYNMANEFNERTGQVLFNNLRHEIADVVRSTNLDTFYKEMSLEEITDWLENHIIFDNQGKMVRLFSGRHVLWEEEEHGDY